MHVYEIRSRKDHRGVDLISDVLPFGRLWYDTPDNVIGYAMHYSLHMMLRSVYTMLVQSLRALTLAVSRRSDELDAYGTVILRISPNPTGGGPKPTLET